MLTYFLSSWIRVRKLSSMLGFLWGAIEWAVSAILFVAIHTTSWTELPPSTRVRGSLDQGGKSSLARSGRPAWALPGPVHGFWSGATELGQELSPPAAALRPARHGSVTVTCVGGQDVCSVSRGFWQLLVGAAPLVFHPHCSSKGLISDPPTNSHFLFRCTLFSASTLPRK